MAAVLPTSTFLVDGNSGKLRERLPMCMPNRLLALVVLLTLVLSAAACVRGAEPLPDQTEDVVTDPVRSTALPTISPLPGVPAPPATAAPAAAASPSPLTTTLATSKAPETATLRLTSVEDWPQLGHDPQRTSASSHTVGGPYRFYWRWMDAPLASRAQPVVSQGRLFIGGLDGVMYALDATHDAQGGNPRILWQRDLGSPVRSGAAVDGDIVIVGTHHGTIHGIDARSGELIWSTSTEGAILAAPLLHHQVAYLGSADGSFYAVRTTDGSVLWRQSVGAPILSSAALSSDGGRVLFVAENLVAYALATDSGAIQWETQLQGQSGADRWPVVLDDLVIFRTTPIRHFHQLLRSGDDAMDSAGPLLSDWDSDWNNVRPRIIDYLEAKPYEQTFFALDTGTGQLRGVAPVLYAFGNNDPPSPPVVYSQSLYLPYRSRHGIQTDSLAGVHVTTRYDSELGRMDPKSLDIRGLASPDRFGYQFRLTSDEPAVLTVAGDLLLVDSWERLGGIHLQSGTLVGIAQVAHNSLSCNRGVASNDDLMPFYESCPFPGPRSGEGRSRCGAVVAAGRIFWKVSASGLASIGPANGIATVAAARPSPPPTSVYVRPSPTSISDENLASYVWGEPTRPVYGPPDLLLRLRNEVERAVAVDEHLMPFYLQRGFHGRGSWPPDVANDREPTCVGDSRVYWFDPGELVLTLSLAYPYLDPELQTQTRSYLRTEMARFPPLRLLPWPTDSWLKQGRAREPYQVPVRQSLNTWPPPGVSIQTLYGLWAYAQYTGDWDYVATRWDEIQALFTAKKGSIDSYGEIAGAIGYARLARHVGRSVEAAAGESAAVGAMRSGLDFYRWLNQANALYPPDPSRPREKPGYRAPVFFGLTPEVGRYLHDTNLAAVEQTLDDVIGYPDSNHLWYATRLGLQAETGESSYHTPEIGWAVFLAQAYVRQQPQAQLRYWLDRPWGVGDLWYLQKLIATIEASP